MVVVVAVFGLAITPWDAIGSLIESDDQRIGGLAAVDRLSRSQDLNRVVWGLFHVPPIRTATYELSGRMG